MTPEVLDFWLRGQQALSTAKLLLDADPDASVSRAYYAAYYAVSAFFAFDGRTFTKHTAVESAVHRDLVKGGKWSSELGAAYSWLVTMRYTGDYGGGIHATPADAHVAHGKAAAILQAVRKISPEPLPQ